MTDKKGKGRVVDIIDKYTDRRPLGRNRNTRNKLDCDENKGFIFGDTNTLRNPRKARTLASISKVHLRLHQAVARNSWLLFFGNRSFVSICPHGLISYM